MHREIPVAQIVLNPANGWIQKIGDVYDAAHVPVGVAVKKGRPDRAGLNEWWRGRGIPASRDAFYGKLEELEQRVDERFFKCHRSYLVSLDYVRGCQGGQVLLSQGERIPASRLRERELTQALLRYMKERSI